MRVLTFNIKDGGIHREALLLEVLRASQPDLILLQEITDPKLVEDWATTLKMEFVVAAGHSLRHVAILRRFPIRASSSHTPMPAVSRDFLAAQLEYRPGQSLNVFAAHLAAQPFVLLEAIRLMEIRAVLRRAVQDSSSPCLIGGDFNAVAPLDHPILKRMPLHIRIVLFLQANRFLRNVITAVEAAQFFDCFRVLHRDEGSTVPPPAPTIRFDYLFANEPLKSVLQHCAVVHEPPAVERASDHYPLLADFAL